MVAAPFVSGFTPSLNRIGRFGGPTAGVRYAGDLAVAAFRHEFASEYLSPLVPVIVLTVAGIRRT